MSISIGQLINDPATLNNLIEGIHPIIRSRGPMTPTGAVTALAYQMKLRDIIFRSDVEVAALLSTLEFLGIFQYITDDTGEIAQVKSLHEEPVELTMDAIMAIGLVGVDLYDKIESNKDAILAILPSEFTSIDHVDIKSFLAFRALGFPIGCGFLSHPVFYRALMTCDMLEMQGDSEDNMQYRRNDSDVKIDGDTAVLTA